MINQDQIADVMGTTVHGSDGDKIGKVGQVFLDDQTGDPEWITVATGLFGTRETFVPVAQATFTDGHVAVPFDKDKVKDAPNIDVEAGHISAEAEAELYRYYDMPYEFAGPEGGDRTEGDLPTDDGGRQPEAGTEEARRSRLRRHAAATGAEGVPPMEGEDRSAAQARDGSGPATLRAPEADPQVGEQDPIGSEPDRRSP